MKLKHLVTDRGSYVAKKMVPVAKSGPKYKTLAALFSVGVGLLIIGISLMFNYQWLALCLKILY